MANDKRYAAVMLGTSTGAWLRQGVLDRVTGKVAALGVGESGVHAAGRLNDGLWSFGNYTSERPDGERLRVLGELGPAPEPLDLEPFLLTDPDGDELYIERRRATEGVYITTAEAGVYVTPDQARDVANAVLEFAGLDERV